jgi:hypothetical protein
MPMTEIDFDGLVIRTKTLERENRIWKTVGLMVLMMLGISLTASVRAQQRVQPTPMHATTVTARNFLLEDTAGKVLGQLAVKDGKPFLELYDATGKVTWSTNTRVRSLIAMK